MAIDGRQYKGTKIGKKIEGEAVRGAIHVAVLPVVIDGFLRAGDFFMLKPGSKENGHPVATRTNRESSIGIIDPFLVDEYANAGDIVWGFLHPKAYLLLLAGTTPAKRLLSVRRCSEFEA